jgi:carbon monoxide dehydrogenase subunit G
MATTVTESIAVRRPLAQVAEQVTDPDVVLPMMGGFGRFRKIGAAPDGNEEWDVFLDIGSIHVGGRVHVDARGEHALAWESVRGTQHAVTIDVTGDEESAVVTMRLRIEFAGLVTGRLTELLARGIVRRHLQAGLQQLRHQVEFGG